MSSSMMSVLVTITALLVLSVQGQEKPGKKSPNSICNQKPETGDCRALFTRYYYDEMSGDCKHFTYGGCGGNANNFKKIEECRKKCLTEV